MPALQTLKKIGEKATGWARPAPDDLEQLVREEALHLPFQCCAHCRCTRTSPAPQGRRDTIDAAPRTGALTTSQPDGSLARAARSRAASGGQSETSHKLIVHPHDLPLPFLNCFAA
jgi:hypothetical protein